MIVGDISDKSCDNWKDRKNVGNLINEPTRISEATSTLLDLITVIEDVSVDDSGITDLIIVYRGTYILMKTHLSTESSFTGDVWCYMEELNKINWTDPLK